MKCLEPDSRNCSAFLGRHS